MRRTLPQRQRSLIGPWCFVDHYGPDDVSTSGGMDVAPHPHTGLQTVSWLFEGAIEHIDSGGNQGMVLPGEVNLMTSGRGICHSEVSTEDTTALHGVQLWLALPDSVRNREGRDFEHFAPEVTPFDGGEMLVFLGELWGTRSPVATYSPLMGAEVRLRPGATIDLPINAEFEYGVLVDSGDITVEDVELPTNALGYTGVGLSVMRISNRAETDARLVIIGGEPFNEEILMWSLHRPHPRGNSPVPRRMAGRGRSFRRRRGLCRQGRPGENADGLSRLPAPRLPDVRIKARKNPPPHVQS